MLLVVSVHGGKPIYWGYIESWRNPMKSNLGGNQLNFKMDNTNNRSPIRSLIANNIVFGALLTIFFLGITSNIGFSGPTALTNPQKTNFASCQSDGVALARALLGVEGGGGAFISMAPGDERWWSTPATGGLMIDLGNLLGDGKIPKQINAKKYYEAYQVAVGKGVTSILKYIAKNTCLLYRSYRRSLQYYIIWQNSSCVVFWWYLASLGVSSEAAFYLGKQRGFACPSAWICGIPWRPWHCYDLSLNTSEGS